MRQLALLLCLLLTSTATLASRSVQPFSADYRLLFNGEHVGDARFILQLREGNQYSFESFTRPAGIMNRTIPGMKSSKPAAAPCKVEHLLLSTITPR